LEEVVERDLRYGVDIVVEGRYVAPHGIPSRREKNEKGKTLNSMISYYLLKQRAKERGKQE
jgi:2-phosphoglycerate kinase